jgi:hypothetical protein
MADHGQGFLPVLPALPVGLDYQYNWVNINWGEAAVPETPTSVGGPDAWYIDFGTEPGTEPPPTGGGGTPSDRPAIVVMLSDGRQISFPPGVGPGSTVIG